MSCSIVLFTNATKYMSFASTLFYWPLWGCIFKYAGFYLSKEIGVGSQVYIPTCLWHLMKMEAHCYYALCDLRCNIDTITMITIFYTVVLSTDPGNGTDTQEFCLLIRQGTTFSSTGARDGGKHLMYSVTTLLHLNKRRKENIVSIHINCRSVTSECFNQKEI
jgi:hypothetical protein